MGGLVVRAAGAVAAAPPDSGGPGRELVSDVVTLGTPHLGAPVAWGVGHGSRGLGLLPETAAFGRILDWRSQGVHDLVAGLTSDVPPWPHARYHLVAATLTASSGTRWGTWSATSWSGRARRTAGTVAGPKLFPGADVLHVGGTDHFGPLNHPDVHAALGRWLDAAEVGRG